MEGLDERERDGRMRAPATVEFSIEVDAPAERVWEITSDPRNLPHWDKHIERVQVPPGGLSEGSKYVVRMRFMAVRARIDAEVLEWDPPHRSVLRLRGLLNAKISTTIASLPHDRCLLRQEVGYRFSGGALGAVAARSLQVVGGAQLALKRGVLAQKRQAED